MQRILPCSLAAIVALCLASATAFAKIASSTHGPGHVQRIAARMTPAVSRVDWTREAIARERSGDWQGLLVLGQRWTQAEPQNATAWFVLGRALGQMNRYPEAISAYLKDLEIQPRDLNGRNNLGNAYRESRRFQEAMHAYRDAVRINPDYLPAWYNLGLTFFQLRGVAGVTQALQQLRSVDPPLADTWFRLAAQYMQSPDQRVAQEAVRVLHGLSSAGREHLFGVLLAGV